MKNVSETGMNDREVLEPSSGESNGNIPWLGLGSDYEKRSPEVIQTPNVVSECCHAICTLYDLMQYCENPEVY